jgi:hypothetical protein
MTPGCKHPAFHTCRDSAARAVAHVPAYTMHSPAPPTWENHLLDGCPAFAGRTSALQLANQAQSRHHTPMHSSCAAAVPASASLLARQAAAASAGSKLHPLPSKKSTLQNIGNQQVPHADASCHPARHALQVPQPLGTRCTPADQPHRDTQPEQPLQQNKPHHQLLAKLAPMEGWKACLKLALFRIFLAHGLHTALTACILVETKNHSN